MRCLLLLLFAVACGSNKSEPAKETTQAESKPTPRIVDLKRVLILGYTKYSKEGWESEIVPVEMDLPFRMVQQGSFSQGSAMVPALELDYIKYIEEYNAHLIIVDLPLQITNENIVSMYKLLVDYFVLSGKDTIWLEKKDDGETNDHILTNIYLRQILTPYGIDLKKGISNE
jgi:hypothetical protein